MTPANPTPEPDTPLTDAEAKEDWFPNVELVPSDFARSLERQLADTRRRLAEVEKENAAWREYYIAGVLLDDIDYTHPEHDAAIKRVIKAVEALTPISDGDSTLHRELNNAREWTDREQKEREAHWDQLTALRKAADGMAAVAKRIAVYDITGIGPEARLAYDKYAALIAEGSHPISDSNSPTASRESQG